MCWLGVLNLQICLVSYSVVLDKDFFDVVVVVVDLVFDCIDNFVICEVVNVVCVCVGKFLVSGVVICFEGQFLVFDICCDESFCYYCFYGYGSEVELICSEVGVIGLLVGLVGSLQVLEVFKLLVGFGELLVGCLLLVDVFGMCFCELWVCCDFFCVVCG